ncbi:ROK family protein [Sphingomonas gilva]|uniref:fructokinase n=1 Tax=Sphingomonas gilva TaxID=2305907 RepID=A0A396S002_9SPHN|nr:ROK family protein [Sphingomonas gilva]RHW16675.1 ROK family protein [Sphingomonas gilva]
MGEALYGCVEAGGTKFVLGVASGPDRVIATKRIPTTTPAETLGRMRDWFAEHTIAAFGIGSFGPVILDRADPAWGHIADTPKPGWSGADMAGALSGFAAPVGFDTDVNAAAIGEARWGSGQGAASLVYLTVGTGIGGGAAIGGRPVHGARHPEMGHVRVSRHPDDAGLAGICPFHGDCAEGLANGPSIIARHGASLSELPADHPAHMIEAHYLAQLVQNVVAVLSPQVVVMGGGVMATPGLIDRVRGEYARLAAGYFASPADLIRAPGLGDRSGLLGALALAMAAERG